MELRLARSIGTALPLALLALGACQSAPSKPAERAAATPTTPGRAEISNEYVATARVVTVTPAERRLTLRREDGSLFDLVVSDQVRNFAQISAGDVLKVRYRESFSVQVLPSAQTLEPAAGALMAARAVPGEKPAGGLGAAVSVRVRIVSVDPEHDIVVFAPASGEPMAHRVQRQEGREFIRGLRVGDVVQIDYTEILALGVEKM